MKTFPDRQIFAPRGGGRVEAKFGQPSTAELDKDAFTKTLEKGSKRVKMAFLGLEGFTTSFA